MNTKNMSVKMLKSFKAFSKKINDGNKEIRFPKLELGSIHKARQYGMGFSGRIAIDHDFYSTQPVGHVVRMDDVEVIKGEGSEGF